MNGHASEYELQRQKNIAENRKILASLGLDKFKVSVPAVTQSEIAECRTGEHDGMVLMRFTKQLVRKGCRGGN